MSLPAQSIDWQRLERDVAGLRIGLMMDVGVGLPVDAEIAGRGRGGGAGSSRPPARGSSASGRS